MNWFSKLFNKYDGLMWLVFLVCLALALIWAKTDNNIYGWIALAVFFTWWIWGNIRSRKLMKK